MTGEAIKETSDEVCSHSCVQAPVATICTRSISAGLDWAKGKGANFCEFLSCFEIFLGVPFGLEGLDVSLNRLVVEGVVRCQLLCELCWVLKD